MLFVCAETGARVSRDARMVWSIRRADSRHSPPDLVLGYQPAMGVIQSELVCPYIVQASG